MAAKQSGENRVKMIEWTAVVERALDSGFPTLVVGRGNVPNAETNNIPFIEWGFGKDCNETKEFSTRSIVLQ